MGKTGEVFSSVSAAKEGILAGPFICPVTSKTQVSLGVVY